MMTLDDLLRAIRQGDHQAWQELSRRLIDELNDHFAYEHQEADAKDLVQRTFVIVLEKIDTFELRENQTLRHWVFGIARREVLYAHRQRGRDARLAAQHAAFHASPSPPTGPESDLDRKRHRDRVERVLQQLDTPHRDAIQNDLERGTAESLAERRGTTRQHAYVIRSRARRKFHRLLEQLERAEATPTARKPTPPPPS